MIPVNDNILLAGRQRDRQAGRDRQTERHTGRQTSRQTKTDRQAGWQTERLTNRLNHMNPVIWFGHVHTCTLGGTYTYPRGHRENM